MTALSRRGLLLSGGAFLFTADLSAELSKPRGVPKSNEQFMARIRHGLNLARLKWGLEAKFRVFMHHSTLHRYEDCGIAILETASPNDKEAPLSSQRRAAGYPLYSLSGVPPGFMILTADWGGMLVYDTKWRPDKKDWDVEWVV